MSNRLKDSLSSQYFGAANRLNAKSARRRVVAYVESYDDVFFWRTVLSACENEKLYFEVMLPTRSRHLERGKKAALMELLGKKVGQDMIACVDADYDYLIQGANHTSETILSSPYVFHTYAYAIENLQCYAPSLRDVCVAVTLNDRQIFDIEEYLRRYSRLIYPLFVWNIWYYRGPHYGQFSITDFLRIVETGNFKLRQAAQLLDRVRHKVDAKVKWLRQKNPRSEASYSRLEQELTQLGVTPDNTYLYIQGHHLFDRVVVPMLENICRQLINERQTEISRQSMHATQRRNELSSYLHSVGDVTETLKKAQNYMACELFQRIREDVKTFVNAALSDT